MQEPRSMLKDKKSVVSCEAMAEAQHNEEKAEGPVHPLLRLGEGEDGLLQVQDDEGETVAAGEEAHRSLEQSSKNSVASCSSKLWEAIAEALLQGKEDNYWQTRKLEGEEGCFVMGGELWYCSEEPESGVLPRNMQAEKAGCEMRRVEEHEREEPEVIMMGPDDMPHWMTVAQYRRHWNRFWSGLFGSFEDITRIPPMRFTDKPVNKFHATRQTLQVFSVKLAATRGSLQLPLDVFGMVALRDPIDHNRIVIFQRKREDCQTLTAKDPYLVLSGPTRAVMFSESKVDPVVIEVDLKVKGTNESEDECLSFLVTPHTCSGTMFSRAYNCVYSTNLITLEFTLGHIVSSVEATIFVQVIQGSWPDGLRGIFAVSTTGFSDTCTAAYSSGVGHERITLLDTGSEKLPVAGDGEIKLSRRVISVEDCGELIFQARALEGDTQIVEKNTIFKPLEANKRIGELDLSFCRMQVTVFWSLVSEYN
ncbi:hypothetical protein BS78_02G377100 [Paspalum vaginatum]|nr:hypothetical protein BS78_02G377100 [Paspalum vaginatum]